MPGAYGDRVQETTTTVGLVAVVLGGAVAGFQAFSAVFQNYAVVRYTIAGGTEFETGEGVYYLGTIQRTGKVFSSSNTNQLVNFSSGTKAVWCDVPAEALADIGVTLALAANSIPQ